MAGKNNQKITSDSPSKKGTASSSKKKTAASPKNGTVKSPKKGRTKSSKTGAAKSNNRASKQPLSTNNQSGKPCSKSSTHQRYEFAPHEATQLQSNAHPPPNENYLVPPLCERYLSGTENTIALVNDSNHQFLRDMRPFTQETIPMGYAHSSFSGCTVNIASPEFQMRSYSSRPMKYTYPATYFNQQLQEQWSNQPYSGVSYGRGIPGPMTHSERNLVPFQPHQHNEFTVPPYHQMTANYVTPEPSSWPSIPHQGSNSEAIYHHQNHVTLPHTEQVVYNPGSSHSAVESIVSLLRSIPAEGNPELLNSNQYQYQNETAAPRSQQIMNNSASFDSGSNNSHQKNLTSNFKQETQQSTYSNYHQHQSEIIVPSSEQMTFQPQTFRSSPLKDPTSNYSSKIQRSVMNQSSSTTQYQRSTPESTSSLGNNGKSINSNQHQHLNEVTVTQNEQIMDNSKTVNSSLYSSPQKHQVGTFQQKPQRLPINLAESSGSNAESTNTVQNPHQNEVNVLPYQQMTSNPLNSNSSSGSILQRHLTLNSKQDHQKLLMNESQSKVSHWGHFPESTTFSVNNSESMKQIQNQQQNQVTVPPYQQIMVNPVTVKPRAYVPPEKRLVDNSNQETQRVSINQSRSIGSYPGSNAEYSTSNSRISSFTQEQATDDQVNQTHQEPQRLYNNIYSGSTSNFIKQENKVAIPRNEQVIPTNINSNQRPLSQEHLDSPVNQESQKMQLTEFKSSEAYPESDLGPTSRIEISQQCLPSREQIVYNSVTSNSTAGSMVSLPQNSSTGINGISSNTQYLPLMIGIVDTVQEQDSATDCMPHFINSVIQFNRLKD